MDISPKKTSRASGAGPLAVALAICGHTHFARRAAIRAGGRVVHAITSPIGYPREFPEVIAMLEDASVDVAPLISHRFALADFMDALKTARDPNSSAKVMITFDA